MSDSPTTAPDEACGRANAARIELEGLDLDADAVTVDLAALVAGADVSVNVQDSPPGCMSSPMEGDDCAPVFTALGLGFDDGACVNGCAGQSVFATP